MRLLSIAVSLWGFLLAQHAKAEDPDLEERCLVACQEIFVSLGVTFSGSPKTAAAQKCQSDLFVRSVYLCGRMHCTYNDIFAGAEYLGSQCGDGSYYNDTTWKRAEDVSVPQLAAIHQFKLGDKNLKLVNTTIVPSENLFDLGTRSVDHHFNAVKVHFRFAWALLVFWAGIMAIGMTYRLVTIIQASRLSRKTSNSSSAPSTFWRKIRADLVLPPTFKEVCSTPHALGTLPPRIETLVITAYVCLNVVLAAVSYSTIPHELYYNDESYQVWRFLCDRLGWLAYANLVLIWLFAIRNNFLIWVTGWSFATFNHFHRWVARTTALEMLLHAIGRSYYATRYIGVDAYHSYFQLQNWIAGSIAIVSVFFTLAIANRAMRAKFYDIFLVIHQAFAIMILIALYFHTKKFNGERDPWLFSCVAMWAFDRTCRILRIAYLAVSGKGFNTTAELFDEANLIRVDIAATQFRGRLAQSGYVFLYSPFTLTFWQNHPFTLVRWRSPANSPAPSTSADAAIEEKAIAQTSTSSLTDRSPYHYSLLIRPTTGYTGRLRRSLIGKTGPEKSRFLLEGPYSDNPDLSRFSDVWMFISGSGISVAISSVYEILESNPTASIRIVWSSRSPALVKTITERELACALAYGNVKLDVYITGTSGKEKSFDGLSEYNTTAGRADVTALLHGAVEEQKVGALGVVVCGAAEFTDQTRRAFCQELRTGKRDMSLFIQSFNW